jgi:HEAT repeat protein
MELEAIKQNLYNEDYQYRLRAVHSLNGFPTEVALPLLLNQVKDDEFLVRSFVARELGKHQTPESFAALLELMKLDNTPNVRAEAANSLSLFGKASASHLLLTIHTDDHWLVSASILAALIELECWDELFDACCIIIHRDDQILRETGIGSLAPLAQSHRAKDALAILNQLKDDPNDRIRARVKEALAYFAES